MSVCSSRNGLFPTVYVARKLTCWHCGCEIEADCLLYCDACDRKYAKAKTLKQFAALCAEAKRF